MALITMNNVNCKISGLESTILNMLAKKLTIKDKGYYFSPAYRSGRWDGTVKFLTRPENTFPTGLLPIVLAFLQDIDCPVDIRDMRLEKDNYCISTVADDYKVSETKESRGYQIDTINLVANNKIAGLSFPRGIINIATNGGKTVIAESIIKELYEQIWNTQKIFLFVTHSKEIAYQTRRSIENDLNIPVGIIGDGKWNVEPLTIMLPQTAYKRMKDKKPEFTELKNKVIGFIADECLSGDTMILLPHNKTMPIRRIVEKKIKTVMSYNLLKQKMEPKPILRYMVTPATEQFYKITFTSSIFSSEQILKATYNHKIYTVNRGYVQVEDLTVNDSLKMYDIDTNQEVYGRILDISQVGGIIPQYKYNLEVADNHNYYANNVLVSNCHHASANSFYEVFNNLDSAYIRLGLTGTVDKSNPVNEMKMYACTGPVIKRISNDYLIKQGVSAKPICLMFKCSRPELNDLEYSDAYNLGIVENEFRHDIIYDICEKETQSNNKVLILVERIEHGEKLQELLSGLSKEVYFTNGQLSSDEREHLLDRLRNGDLDVLIASNILDEGVDVSGINALIYARGMKSMRKLLQGIGRGLRAKVGENVLRFYDFIDDTHLQLLKHSKERYETLAEENFIVKLMNIQKYKQSSWEEIMK